MLAHPAEYDRSRWPSLLERAAREVFQLMLNEELARGSGAPSSEELDITSMVGLAGRLCGVVSVRCPMRAASLIASRMLGREGTADHPETWDAFGEICNMVAGNFKNRVAGLADGCMMSVPTVISGAHYRVHPAAGSTHIEVHFAYRDMPLVVAIEVHQ